MIKTSIPPLSLIVAVDQRGGIGKSGKIPWNEPKDLAHFKEVTKGGVCIMGRKTYMDMLSMVTKRKRKKGSKKSDKELMKNVSEILPGRESFVVTSDPTFVAQGATTVTTIRDAIQSLDETDDREIFVIGGSRMFVEALAWTKKIYMTLINKDYNCDVFFPINSIKDKFSIVDGKEDKNLKFITYERSKL